MGVVFILLSADNLNSEEKSRHNRYPMPMAGICGKSGPPGNQNAFKHGLAAIQKRREEGVPTQHEENVRQQILDFFQRRILTPKTTA
jgi:hypothetical protein